MNTPSPTTTVKEYLRLAWDIVDKFARKKGKTGDDIPGSQVIEIAKMLQLEDHRKVEWEAKAKDL